MIIQNNKDKTLILVQPESALEEKRLKEFPGLLRQGPYFFASNKPHIVFSIYTRLKRKYPVKTTKDILDVVNSSFKLKDIPKDFKFHTKPLRHQEVALRYMHTVKNAGLLLEPGLGKTKTVLDFIALEGFNKSLIVCPKALLFVWEDECKIHRPDKTTYVVKTTDWEKEKEEALKADIIVVNYNKAVIMEKDLAKVKFEFIGLDEGLIKDPSTERTKAITRLGKDVKSKCIMSGTLINNSPLDAFAPIRFLEPSLVGQSFANFRNEYCVVVQKNNIPLVVGYRRIDEIRKILESTSIVMTKDEWLDLPGKKFFDIKVRMSEEQHEAYYELLGNYIVNIQGRIIEVDNPLTIAAKLVQIANGFIYAKNDDSITDLQGQDSKKKIKRETIFFRDQPKIEALLELLNNKLTGRRMIVWYNMSAERELISQALERSGITFSVIAGGEKDTGGKVREFNINPNIRILLCQAKSVNYGITVLGKKREELEEKDIEVPPHVTPEIFTHIFYSLNFSLEVYLQQQDRSHRIGQVHECEYYRILSNSPIEMHIGDKLAEKISIKNQMLIDYVESLKEGVD